MSQRTETQPVETPAPQLIELGAAKLRTNSGGGFLVDEIEPEKPYNPA